MGEVSLANVWVQTWADGLVRADQIVGIEAHPTPAVAGKPSRWLVDGGVPLWCPPRTRPINGLLRGVGQIDREVARPAL